MTFSKAGTADYILELIDTLWNVNRKKSWKLKMQANELIDTLWNVNVDIYIRLRQKSRINRYIMECKYL